MAWATHLVFFFPLWLGDMPALLYRWYFRAHSVKSLERNVLGFVGMSPFHETLIGTVDKLDEAGFKKWQAKLHQLGVAAQ
jgi:putative NADPH-quinone reductase